MNGFMGRRLMMVGLAVVALGGTVKATSPVPWTTIIVDDMHCADCAKRIARKLYAVPGVVEVRADVGKNVAYVVPQKDRALSARSLWVAVESAGFKVNHMEGPQGTFKARPAK
jgi:copper chaperone CopZ